MSWRRKRGFVRILVVMDARVEHIHESLAGYRRVRILVVMDARVEYLLRVKNLEVHAVRILVVMDARVEFYSWCSCVSISGWSESLL